MDEAGIRKALHELVQTVTPTLRVTGQKVAGGIYQSDERPVTAEDALDFLRLQLKYMQFDLEATRRENRYLRQLLEKRPQPPRSNGADDVAEGF